MLTQPVADVAISYISSGAASGAVVVDLALSPAGDASLVVGKARLAQDMARFLSTPAGAHFADPSYGAGLWSEIGRPAETSDEVYISMVEEAESAFLHAQTVAAAAGFVDLAGQLQEITDTRVDRTQPGVVAVGFTAVTRAGETVQASTPLGG